MSLARIARFVLGVVIGLMGWGVLYGVAFLGGEVLPDGWPKLWYGAPTFLLMAVSVLCGVILAFGGPMWGVGIIDWNELK